MRNCQLSLVTCPTNPWRSGNCQLSRAFTLIELLVVMGIFAIMIGFTSINLIRPQTTSSLYTTIDQINSDLKQQQIRAMSGDGASSYGVYFETNRYTLFTGSAYSVGASDNFIVNLEGGITISNPQTSVVFAQRSGETTSTSFTITNTNSGEQKIITINSLGAITIQ